MSACFCTGACRETGRCPNHVLSTGDLLAIPQSPSDRIEAKLDRILAILEKPRVKRDGREFDEAKYTDDFLACWKLYPKRAGSNPKLPAYRAFNARKKAGASVKYMMQGTELYAEYCKATGILGTSFVMNAARFFGPNKEYANLWDIPPQTTQPRTDEEWIAYGRKMGVEARTGETMAQYKHRLQSR